MDQQEAEKVLAAEVASGSPAGRALVAFLSGFELELYRQSHTVADPFLTGKVAGRGEGVNLALRRIQKLIDGPSPTRAPTAPL